MKHSATQPLTLQEMSTLSGGMEEMPLQLGGPYDLFDARMMALQTALFRLVFSAPADSSYACAKVGYCS